jgi:hypothetical protein
LGEDNFYMIVGKVVYSGLDAEGNVHLVLRNSNPVWAERAVAFLRTVEGRVVKLKVSMWKRLKAHVNSNPPF